MNEIEESYGRAFLNERRHVLRLQYAKFRECGSRMRQKNLIQWSPEHHRYYAEWMSSRRVEQRRIIGMLLDLQKNIAEQAMLLLELEHSLDCQKRRTGNEPE